MVASQDGIPPIMLKLTKFKLIRIEEDLPLKFLHLTQWIQTTLTMKTLTQISNKTRTRFSHYSQTQLFNPYKLDLISNLPIINNSKYNLLNNLKSLRLSLLITSNSNSKYSSNHSKTIWLHLSSSSQISMWTNHWLTNRLINSLISPNNLCLMLSYPSSPNRHSNLKLV
jgi:hypothetical protein